MQSSSVSFDEVKVNSEIMPNLTKQIRLKKYEELYDILDPLPKELIELILSYDIQSLPSALNACLFGGHPTCVKKIRAHSTPIYCITPLQKGFATAAVNDDQIKIWDEKGDLGKVLNTKMSQVNCMQKLPNGDLIVAGCTQNTMRHNVKSIQMWKLDTFQQIKEINGLPGYITCMTMVHPSDGGQKFICGDNDGRIEIYHPLKKETRVIQERGTQILALAALAHQRLIVARRGERIQLWDWSNEDKDPVLKNSVYFNQVVYPSVIGSWGDNNINCIVPMSDSVLAFGDNTSMGKWGRIIIKDNKIATINIEAPLGIGVKTIKRLAKDKDFAKDKDIWAIILMDGTGLTFTLDKKNDIQQFNGRDGKPLVWQFGKHTTSFATLQRPQNWMLTGNKQGELLLWYPEALTTAQSQ
jgi:WD40 repeat protein